MVICIQILPFLIAMDKKDYERFKKTAILIIAVIFIVQRSVVYFQEKKETNEIVFYSLPPQSESVRELPVESNETVIIKETENEQSENTVSDKININTADSEELQKLYRIGPALAERIIEYRNSFGNFVTIEEIMEVKGIGEKTFEKIKDEICVK